MAGGLIGWKGLLENGPALRRNLFALFFLLSLLPRLLVFGIAINRERPVYEYQDSWGYIGPAQRLIEGKGYQDEGGGQAFWWPPGYPAFLASFFATGIASPEHLAGVLVAQVLLASLVTGMSSLVALDLGGVRAALTAGSLMVFEPSSIAYANLVLAETLFTFLLLLGVLSWSRWWSAPTTVRLMTLAGLVALLPMVRPVATYLWVPLALLFAFTRPGSVVRWPSLLAFVALATAPMAGWTLRNYSHLRVPVFATVGLLNQAKFARAVEELAGEPVAASPFMQPWQDGFGNDQGLSFPQVVAMREAYFRRVLLKHPVAAVKRVMLTGAGILGVPDKRLADLILREAPALRGGSVRGHLEWVWSLGWLGGLLLVGTVVAAGGFLSLPALVWRSRAWPRKQQALLGLLVLLVLYQLLISSFVMYQGERFRVPIMPLLAVTFASALVGERMGREDRLVDSRAGQVVTRR